MSSPTIASVRRGAAPLAEARTTPCCRTKANASSAVAHVVMTPNDQANLRAAPTFDKLKARHLVRVEREHDRPRVPYDLVARNEPMNSRIGAIVPIVPKYQVAVFRNLDRAERAETVHSRAR